jgi:hypothetical protein
LPAVLVGTVTAVALPFLASRTVVLIGTELGAFLQSPGLDRPRPALVQFFHFDALWYASIWQQGYHQLPQAAFFPLYPYLVHFLARALGGEQLAALLISNACLAAALALLYLLGRELDEGKARTAVWIAALWPWSSFYSYPYSESLLLLLVCLAFWLMARGRWLAAGTVAALASATRAPGLLLMAAIAGEAIQGLAAHHVQRRQLLPLTGALVLAPLGLVIYALVLAKNLHDPLAFAHAQSIWAAHAPRNPLFPAGAVWQVIHDLNPFKAEGFGLPVLLMFAGGVVWVASRMPWRYTGYGAAIIVLAFLQGYVFIGSFHSVPRYLVVAFPVYFAFAALLQRVPAALLPWMTVSASLLMMESVLYGANHFTG